MSDTHVAVIGAGVGGLVTALILASRGLRVTVVETGERPGGKLRPVRVDGHTIDAGPTVFTMRWVFDDLMEELGLPSDALPQLQPLSVLARHAWAYDGSQLDLHADRQRTADAIAAFSSPAEARRFLAFSTEAARVYRALEGPHIRSTRPGVGRMVADLGVRGLTVLTRLGAFASLAGNLSRRFGDPRLQQLFARYATYCGSSPWTAPATLMLVSHVEQQGVWAVQGGMGALAESLAALVQKAGATIRYGTACTGVETADGRVSALILGQHERLPVDAAVFNGDCAALPALLGSASATVPRPIPVRSRSLSAVTWATVARPEGFPLVRHNVFFDSDYGSEFDDIFQRRSLPGRGTVYVCAQDRHDAGLPTGSPERLLLLMNAPADGDRRQSDEAEVDACETRCLQLMRRCGLQLSLSRARLRRTPTDFGRLYPGTGGALYGEASNGWMAVFRRPGASTAVKGLYLAGGSVHPGPGVPMAAMSGRIAAATLMADLASMRRSHLVRIAGGMSTRSATTAFTR